ncbi:hypothetical protein TNCV_4521431 [Trichonephila clavipes]|nr:hypothetical protein TNCV_4521431 [Trichonephila clavipes]
MFIEEVAFVFIDSDWQHLGSLDLKRPYHAVPNYSQMKTYRCAAISVAFSSSPQSRKTNILKYKDVVKYGDIQSMVESIPFEHSNNTEDSIWR